MKQCLLILVAFAVTLGSFLGGFHSVLHNSYPQAAFWWILGFPFGIFSIYRVSENK